MKKLITILIIAFSFTANAQLTNKAWSIESLNSIKQNIRTDLGSSFSLIDSSLVNDAHFSPYFTFKSDEETVKLEIVKDEVNQKIDNVFLSAKLNTAISLYQSLYGLKLNPDEILKKGYAKVLQKDKITIAFYRDSRNKNYWQIAERSN